MGITEQLGLTKSLRFSSWSIPNRSKHKLVCMRNFTK